MNLAERRGETIEDLVLCALEEQKERVEVRYRELLENSVKDALKLSEENAKLRTLIEAKNKQI